MGSISLFVSPQGEYLGIIGRQAIPGPYILRYPNPRNGQTNVPVANGIRFTIKSDGPGIDISKVRVKIVDSWGTNIYDSSSPYFSYSGNKFRYDVVVRPPQPWAYEESVQAEIDAEDLAGRKGLAYEYVP